MLDYEANQEAIAQIDNQLLEMGIEQITHAEVLEKMGITAQPMYDVYSSDDTSWFSERWITVWNGQRYEVQIVTGQMKNSNSPLCRFDIYAKERTFGVAVGLVNAIQVIAPSIATSSISKYSPTVGAVLSGGITLYDVVNAYIDGVSSTTIIKDAAFSLEYNIATTMRFAFVKYEGALDNGNQILAYVGNMVNYAISIGVPTYDITEGSDGYVSTDIEHVKYYDSSKSYSYDVDECKIIAARNFWNY